MTHETLTCGNRGLHAWLERPTHMPNTHTHTGATDTHTHRSDRHTCQTSPTHTPIVLAGSHWEKRQMLAEFMCAAPSVCVCARALACVCRSLPRFLPPFHLDSLKARVD